MKASLAKLRAMLQAALLSITVGGWTQAPAAREISLEISQEGRYLLNATPVEASQLEQHLRSLRGEGQPIRLEIHASPLATHEVVAGAVGAAKRAGVDSIAFITRPAPSQGSEPSGPQRPASQP